MPLEVRQKEVEGIVVLELHGRLVVGPESSDFRRTIAQLVSTDHKSIILDMKHVDFIDSTGLGTLVQGSVEASNVNVVQEMVDMIQTQRAYEMNSKAVQSTDQMLQYLSQNL